MKTPTRLLTLILFTALVAGCGSGKPNPENSAAAIDSSEYAGEPISPDTFSVKTYLTAAENQTAYILRWKDIWIMEDQATYTFEDLSSNSVTFNFIEIPGWDEENNPYYNVIHREDRMFPELTLKEVIKDKWLTVISEKKMKYITGMDEEAEMEVIVGMEIR